MNIAQMMKQAQQMQKKLQETQNELANTEFSSVSGNGAVSVICDGQGDSVDIDTVEMLEDLITTAINNATEQATKEMQTKMKSLTGGINIPGLF